MVNHWVFVVNDWTNNLGKKYKGQEIFDILRTYKIWGIGNKTPNRKRLVSGDKVVFYLAGSDGQKFIGKGILNSATSPFKGDWGYTEEVNNIIKEWGNLVTFKEFEEFDDLKLLSDIVNELDFIVKKEIGPVYFQSGVRAVTKEDFDKIISEGLIKISKKGSEEGIENENQFVLEKYLQSFIIENWAGINFGRTLQIYEDENGNKGEQYTTDVGYIDILAKDDFDNFVVIELKKGRESDKVIGQLLRYMGWVKKHLAKDGQKVEGLIICNDSDLKMDYAVSVVPEINIKKYSVNFNLI